MSSMWGRATRFDLLRAPAGFCVPVQLRCHSGCRRRLAVLASQVLQALPAWLYPAILAPCLVIARPMCADKSRIEQSPKRLTTWSMPGDPGRTSTEEDGPSRRETSQVNIVPRSRKNAPNLKKGDFFRTQISTTTTKEDDETLSVIACYRRISQSPSLYSSPLT